MSLRYKLLIVMLSLTGLSLAAVLTLAVSLFKEDKIAYIFDSSLANSKGIANQIKTELHMRSAQMSLFVSSFDFTKRIFESSAQNIFDRDDNLDEVILSKFDGNTFEIIATMKKVDFSEEKSRALEQNKILVERQAIEDTLSFKVVQSDQNILIYSQKVLMEGDPDSYFITSVDHEEGLLNLLKRTSNYDNFIVRSNGQVLLQSKIDSPVISLKDWKFFNKISNDSIPDGAEETTNINSVPSLVSFSKVGLSNLISISTISRDVALNAIETLLLKASLFFIALISLTSMLAIFFSKKITSQLSVLDSATTDLAAGNFEVNLNIESSDEVGNLSRNFNTMVTKVSALMKDNVEKARMEKELETAKLVQDTYFPDNNAQIDRVKISGYYRSASECGGDWWYYFKSSNKVFVCIGDATGHGASAALITSAARSAVSLIEMTPNITPASFLTLLNRAIYMSSKGQIQLTFFVASIDTELNKLTYANASHSAPYLIRKSSEPITKSNLVPLLAEEQGLRLGHVLNCRYSETVCDIFPGDIVFAFTDGLTDLENQEKKMWDERGLIKALVHATNERTDLENFVNIVKDESIAYSDKIKLIDDVTFCAFEFN